MAVELAGEGAGGIEIEMKGDSDRDLKIFIKFEKIFMNSKSAHVIQLRNEDYDLNTIDLSELSVHNLLAVLFCKWSSSVERTSFR